MGDAEIQFDVYGVRGDQLGARRIRRAFRWCVAACLLSAGGLWFAETYLRSGDAERLYVRALTHEPSSARVLLLQAIKIDAERRESPTPKYTIAMAERAVQDEVLQWYERAYKLDPHNPMLAIRYGNRLFQAGKFKEARERYREAGAQAPKNALPGYLEAAALQWTTHDNTDLAESLALIARANSRGDPVVFPRPAWAGAVLPSGGVVYTRLRREALDECCAPIYRYADHILDRARADIQRGQLQYWDSWLSALQAMGDRLMRSPGRSAVSAIAGIEIQLAVLDLRNRIAQSLTESVDTEMTARRLQLQQALGHLKAFELSREEIIRANREAHLYPLKMAALSTAFLTLLYSFVYIVAKIVRVGRRSWTLRHARWAYTAFTFVGGAFFLALWAQAPLENLAANGGQWREWLARSWLAVLLGSVLLGVLYPSLHLPSPRKAIRSMPQGNADLLPPARRARRVAGVSLMRRYFGILTGIILCTGAVWAVLYRAAVGLYPWQLQLLTTGLANEEAELVRTLISTL